MRQPFEKNKKKWSREQQIELLGVLKSRFENNMDRHKGAGMGRSTGKDGSKYRKALGIE